MIHFFGDSLWVFFGLCPSLIEIGSKAAEKNSAQTNRQTNRQTDRHYENNGHMAVNKRRKRKKETGQKYNVRICYAGPGWP